MGTRNLRYIIMLPALVAIIVVLALALFFALTSRNEEAELQMAERSQDLAITVKSMWQSETTRQDPEIGSPTDITHQNISECPVVSVISSRQFSEEGSSVVYYGSANSDSADPEKSTFESRAIEVFNADKSLAHYYEIEELDDGRTFEYATPILFEEECLQCHGSSSEIMNSARSVNAGHSVGDLAGIMYIDLPTTSYDVATRSYILFDVSFTTFLLALSIITLWFPLRKFVTRPLEKLEEATTEISNGKLDLRVDAKAINARGELATLVERFNQMTENIHDSYSSVEEEVRVRIRELEFANMQLNEHQEKVEMLNEQLRKDSDYKSEFLATISHELKTPLTSIIANIDVLKQSGGEDSQQAISNDVDQNADMLLRLIDQILDASRLDAGKMKLNLEVTDIVDIVNAINPTASSLAQQKGIHYQVFLEDDIPIVMADSDKLVKIIMNLVGNALKFTKEGGHVSLGITYQQNNSLLVIEVVDDGVGILADETEKIFEIFYQSDQSASRVYGGTGLGLSLVREFAHLHGGDAIAESIEKGSRFVVHVVAEPWREEQK